MNPFLCFLLCLCITASFAGNCTNVLPPPEGNVGEGTTGADGASVDIVASEGKTTDERVADGAVLDEKPLNPDTTGNEKVPDSTMSEPVILDLPPREPGPGRDIPAGAGLPSVPAEGWAKSVVSANITQELTDPKTNQPVQNVATDPRRALGPPEEGNDGSVALGKEGAYIILDFGENTVAKDGDGDDIVILEIGLFSGGIPEPYRVEVSNSPTGPFVELGTGRGESSFDLKPTGLKHARYIRIESQATIEQIFSGLGSPLYPGPEIDAVGAVYPGKP